MRWLIVLPLLFGGCAAYDSCDPFSVEQKMKYELQDGECVEMARRAIYEMKDCPNISNLQFKSKQHPNFPGGHAWVKGKNNGKVFEILD